MKKAHAHMGSKNKATVARGVRDPRRTEGSPRLINGSLLHDWSPKDHVLCLVLTENTH